MVERNISNKAPIRIIVVDDSSVVRTLFRRKLSADPNIEVVGCAADAARAKIAIARLKPDVVTLDIEMPGASGLQLLDMLMTNNPLPVVMVSTLTRAGADATLKALELGAVDYLAKPTGNSPINNSFFDLLIRKIRIAATARLQHSTGPKTPSSRISNNPSKPRRAWPVPALIAIGASTGGTEAIRKLLSYFPPNAPPTVVTQHMPPGFTESFAERLNQTCKSTVCEAADRQRLLPGHVYIAPGSGHLKVTDSPELGPICRIDEGPAVHHHKPSVDVMFDSVASSVGSQALGLLLTGMGADGAQGLLAMRRTGAHTVAQDEASSIIYGMPRAAMQINAAVEQLPLDIIATQCSLLATRQVA